MCQKPVSFCSMVTPTGPQACTGDRPGVSAKPTSEAAGVVSVWCRWRFRDTLSFLPTKMSFPSFPPLFSNWWAGEIGFCQWPGGFSTAWVLDASPEGLPLHSTQRATTVGSSTGCCSHLATGVLALHWPEAMQRHLCREMMSRKIKIILNEHF